MRRNGTGRLHKRSLDRHLFRRQFCLMSSLFRDVVTVIKAAYQLIGSSGNQLRFMVCLAAPCENLDLSLEVRVNIEVHLPHHFSVVK
jgi:hypothetical protein